MCMLLSTKYESTVTRREEEETTHLFKQRWLDVFWKSSSVSCQFLIDPFTNPDTIMKPKTRTLTQVNILLTMADSFTPRVKSPEKAHKQENVAWWCELCTRRVLPGTETGMGQDGDLRRIQVAPNHPRFLEASGNGAELIIFPEAGIKITKVHGVVHKATEVGLAAPSGVEDATQRAPRTAAMGTTTAHHPAVQAPPRNEEKASPGTLSPH